MTRRLTLAGLSILAACALMATMRTSAWSPQNELPTAQDRLERLDAALLPIHGALMASLDDFSAAPTSLGLEPAFLQIVQARAVQAWEVVRAMPFDVCYDMYRSVLLVGYASLADGVDSYRAGDPIFQSEVATGLYLVRDRATLERNATTCEPAAPEPTPQPTPTPVRHTPTPTEGA